MVLDGELSSLQTDVLLSSLAPPDRSMLRLNSGKQVLLADSQRFIVEVHIYTQWNLSIFVDTTQNYCPEKCLYFRGVL